MKQLILMLAIVAMQYTVNSGDTLQSMLNNIARGMTHVKLRSFAKESGN
ncbi:hypothetical protein SAMN04515679_2460 [Pelosinus fermentans]|uniref:Uncharacterized protein n=1 Tax=Pelosinus fermentans B4 TaxID=1149862 RepID=I8RJY7_9FIRM|nr:hypothetical protein FB4_3410 [Pelosinus fermentans B4]EIW24369.1 hypothetical protein FA11_3411 [Pelosinus fermentans A11]OAM94338.1 hypothetical protein FR7_02356 [Pelosinus fermentans DSM 17108]SDR06554.1 hypothetical protein SAMN04515679_2460 [Pelosinus fermentans]